MSDIVERLRKKQDVMEHDSDGVPYRILRHNPLQSEAADEITRLRASEQAVVDYAEELERKLTAVEAVVEAARDVRCEYFTAYPTEGELLKRMQALDAALRSYRAAKEE